MFDRTPPESPCSRDRSSGHPFGRGEQSIGSLLQVVPHFISAGIGIALDAVDLTRAGTAIREPGRGQPVSQLEARDLDLPFLGAADQERVVALAPGSSAGSLNRADAVADRAPSQRDEPREASCPRCRATTEPKFGG